MTSEETLQRINRQRVERAAAIQADPSRVKLCESCDGLVWVRHHLCPYCNAYRFNTDPEAIMAHAALLGTRPAVSNPYLPRFATPKALSYA